MTTTMVNIEAITKAVELACRAPSTQNSQPWRWVASTTVVDLFADPNRILRSHDNSGREAIMSCGAALDQFRVEMGAAGWDTHSEEFHLGAVTTRLG
jgi:hypothetical protein